MKNPIATSLLAGLLALACVSHSTAAVIITSFTVANTDTPNLTTIGTTDWGKFGYAQFAHPDYEVFKLSATNIASVTGATALNAIGGNQPTFSWTDGTPLLSSTSNWGFRNPGNTAMTFNITSVAGPNEVKIWAGAFGGTNGTLTATLGSNPAVINSSFTGGAGDNVIGFTLLFTPDFTGQVLNINWVSDGSGILSAATLAAVPEPSVFALLALGALVLVIARRRRRVSDEFAMVNPLT